MLDEKPLPGLRSDSAVHVGILIGELGLLDRFYARKRNATALKASFFAEHQLLSHRVAPNAQLAAGHASIGSPAAPEQKKHMMSLRQVMIRDA